MARCEAGHEISEVAQRRSGPCPACRIDSVAAQVAAADPTLDRDLITQAIEAVVTNPAALRELFAALDGGPEALVAGAPAVVGRLVGELVARGSRLAPPACSICASSARPLIRSGAVGVCPRCRSYQLAAACAGCGQVRRVYGRNAEGAPMCWACAKRPERVCGVCGELAPIAQRACDGRPDVCNDCYRRPIATCERCGHRRRCNFVAAGHAVCDPCSPRRAVPCAHCGATRPPTVRWGEGPVCEPCYRAALSRRGTCSSCGQCRRLVSPPGPAATTCCDCAGVPPLATCQDCGTEECLYDRGRCARCALAARAKTLLADASGAIAPALIPVHESIAASRQPYSALNWLRTGAGAGILAELAGGDLALTHTALDAHPRRGAAEFLRQMLVANGALEARHEDLARMEVWVQAVLAGIDHPEDRRLVQAYATWAVLARLRRRARASGVVRTRHAKIRITAAVRLLAWLGSRGTSLADLGQPDMDVWLAADPPSSYDVRDFLGWAADRKLVVGLEVPTRPTLSGGALDDEVRWNIVERLLHDDTVDLTDRVAGCLVLLYAQQLSRIVVLTVDQVVIHRDGEVHLRLGMQEMVIPEPLGALIGELIATGRRYVGVGSPAHTSWLLPGLFPGRHLSPARLGERLRKLGIDARAGRRSALMHLAARLPAAVLAEALNLTPGTAVDWVRAAGGDWSSYAAQVARGVNDRAEC